MVLLSLIAELFEFQDFHGGPYGLRIYRARPQKNKEKIGTTFGWYCGMWRGRLLVGGYSNLGLRRHLCVRP